MSITNASVGRVCSCHHARPKSTRNSFSKNKKQKVRMELHILTFIEQCSGLQGRRRCLAAGVLDIWHGMDPPYPGTARHRASLVAAWLVQQPNKTPTLGQAMSPARRHPPSLLVGRPLEAQKKQIIPSIYSRQKCWSPRRPQLQNA